jgi:hypothetical protein
MIYNIPVQVRTQESKGKFHPRTGHESPECEKSYSSTLPLTSALDWGECSTPRPGRFTPGKHPVPIVQEAGWAPGPVGTGAENVAPTGIRSPDRSARSESLYKLYYPGPYKYICEIINISLYTQSKSFARSHSP